MSGEYGDLPPYADCSCGHPWADHDTEGCSPSCGCSRSGAAREREPLVGGRYRLALIDAAVAVEAHRDPNPINGSMKNHTIDLVLRDLDALAYSTEPSEAAVELRRTLQQRREAEYRQLHGIDQ